MSTPSIQTSYVHPPIPPRQFDWCAYRDGNEESGPHGWGLTREEAVMELIRQEDEAHDTELDRLRDAAFNALAALRAADNPPQQTELEFVQNTRRVAIGILKKGLGIQ